MRVLDLFSGIGAHALGLRNSGMVPAGFCEIDDYCRLTLRKNFPGVWIHDDIRTLSGELIRERCGHVDLICGGVPCQPASCAGKRKGSQDSRWLWPDFLRVVREVMPRFVLAENVPGIITLKPHGLEWIILQLEAAGYQCVSVTCGAEHAGAPHRRHRVWIVGRRADDPAGPRLAGDTGCEPSRTLWIETWGTEPAGPCGGDTVADAADGGCGTWSGLWIDGESRWRRQPAGTDQVLAHPESRGLGADRQPQRDAGHADECGAGLAEAPRDGERGQPETQRADGVRVGSGGDVADAQLIVGGRGKPQPIRNEEGRTAADWAGESRDAGDGHADAVSCISRLAERRGLPIGTGTQESVPAGGSGHRRRIRWPARPGQPQREWESPRLSILAVGHPTHELTGGLVRAIAGRFACTFEEAEAWWRRNHVKLARLQSKHALKAIGNANPPVIVECIGRAILAAVHETAAHLEPVPDAPAQPGLAWPTPQCFDATGCVRSPEAMHRAESRKRGKPANLREEVVRRAV